MGNIDLVFYLRLFLRRLPQFVLIVGTVTAAGLLVILSLQPAYVATAQLLVESPEIPADMAKSTVPTGAMEQVQIIEQSVLSRSNLIALADRFQLYANQPNILPAQIVDDLRKRLSIAPLLMDSAPGDPAAMVVAVSFSASGSKLSADVTNDVVQMMLQRDAELRTGRANDTLKFFTAEVARLDGDLKQIEANILAFKNAHVNALPDSLEFRRSEQVSLQQRLLLLDQQENTLRGQRADLKTTGRVQGGPPTPEEKTLSDMRAALATQLVLYSPDSSTIKALNARIAALEAHIRSSAAAAAADRANNPDGADSADAENTGSPGQSSSIDAQLAEINDRLNAIAASRATIAKDYDALQATITQTPANEIALDALERNHNNIQAQYDSAVSRLAEAATGQQIESRLKGERLSLIEGAIPPLKPAKPNRTMLALATVIAALMLGLGAVIAPEFLKKSVRRPAELVDKLSIYPMVTVPYIAGEQEHRHRVLAVAATVLTLVAVVPILLLMLNPRTGPVETLLGQALGSLHVNVAPSAPAGP